MSSNGFHFNNHTSSAASSAASGSNAILTSSAFSQSGSSSLAQPYFARQTSTSSMLSTTSTRYDAYQSVPTPLSTSSLDQDAVVYRGVVHAAEREPTTFLSPQTQLWQDQGSLHADPYFAQQASKKLELTSQTYQPAQFAAAAAFALPQTAALVDLPLAPSHIERFTSFYSSAVPAVISKALRIGFQTLSEMRVEFVEESSKGKFRCQCFTDDNESVQFMVRVYKTAGASPVAPYLVEFQRRSGDSVAFFRLFQKLLRSCSTIHTAPYESSFLAPMPSATSFAPPPATLAASGLAMPTMMNASSAIRLDLPSVASLCSMVASDCIESKRESAKALAKVSCASDLFPPTLERQTSSAATAAASQAIWSAIVNILTSGDAECARLGASILRNCLQRGETPMLLQQLEAEPQVLAHLVQRLAQPSDSTDLQQREVRRLVASILQLLVQKRGAAFLQRVSPDAGHVLAAALSQQ